MTYPSARIAVVGTTSWGTTLAVLPARQGHRVSLWARTPEEAQALESARENRVVELPLPVTGAS